MVGLTLSHYRILEKLGSGGMGEVYLAEDTKLSRKVALKVLPPELAGSEERRARFTREAKAIAALNHPNIVTVYSVEESDGVHFITMELVRGKALSKLLPRSGFSINEFFDIAIPLSDAVAAAHQEGITHRDLKPDNVLMGDDGRIKVCDFGLAKLRTESAGGGSSELPTKAMTQEGLIVGTVAYMSPEQAEGKPIDTRSDIFSLGIMLYEMLTGQRPFEGESPASILSSILKDTPRAVTELKPGIPREFSKLIKRCLAKDPIRRYQTAIDVRNELEELKADLSSGDAKERAPEHRSSVNKWLAAATVALLLIVVWLVIPRAPENAVPRVTNPIQVTSAVGVEDSPTWSSDGGRLAYESNQSGNWDIWVTQLGGGQAVNLTAEHAGDDRFPSWSPDGREIAFLSQRNETWSLYTMPAVGGSPRIVTSLPTTRDPLGAPQWSFDGAEIAVPVDDAPHSYAKIVTVQTQTSRQEPLPLSEGGDGCYHLSWSPDGRFFACIDAINSAADVTQLWVFASGGREPIPLTDGRTKVWNPSWFADGRTLFYVSNRGGAMDLWQQRIRNDGTPEGEPVVITAGLGIRSAAFSPDGAKLAYSRGRGFATNVWRVPIFLNRLATWADAEQITFDNAHTEFLDISPDGEHIVVSSDRAGNMDLWILPTVGGEMRQLTTDPTPDWGPRWSPDGTEIAFYAYRSGNRDIWVMPADGGPARQLTSHPASDTVPTWSPDGREIAFSSRRSGNRDIWIVEAEGGEPNQVTVHIERDLLPSWSPDGSWLVFNSTRTGNPRLFRVPSTGGEPEKASNGPAMEARWSPDGKVLYFRGQRERDGNLWAKFLEDGSENPVTDLTGRRGSLGLGLATDGQYLYFNWGEDLGDIWVMDVVTDEGE